MFRASFVNEVPSGRSSLGYNRLTSVNAVNYSWDNNGNLLNDGVNTYTYDSANRLKTLSGQGNSVTYQYNGLGDRLQETVNGNTTTFTIDLNAGLPQALSDGTNTYIYGVDRIAQFNTGTEYFLGDALGSVRQMTSATGVVTYARAYDPYGVNASTSGSSQSAYGYSGEFTSNYMVYLRARFYAPFLNQFIQPDTIVPDPHIPADLNKYTYVRDNPINFTDPSGYHFNYGEIIQPDKRDLTNWLPSAAVYMATDPEIQEIRRLISSNDGTDNIKALYKFKNVVQAGARFDVKLKIKDRLGRSIKFGENWYEYSTSGNILYGFYGSAAGFKAETLHTGAGYAQAKDVLDWVWGCSGFGVLFGSDDPGPFPGLGGLDVHYFDTPDDYHAVDFGIWLYKEYYVPTGNFTRDNFVDGLNRYEFAWGLNRNPDPGDYQPNTTGPYLPDYFDQ